MSATVVAVFAGGLIIYLLAKNIYDSGQRLIQSQERRNELALEKARLELLPKLLTGYLIKMPEEFANKKFGRHRKGLARTFAIRGHRLVIFDENGDGWVGLAMRETLRSLQNSEFELANHFVPFRGQGQSYSGKPIQGVDRELTVYPLWLDPDKVPDTDVWNWSVLEEAFEYEYPQQEDCKADIDRYLSPRHLNGVAKRRLRRQELERHTGRE